MDPINIFLTVIILINMLLVAAALLGNRKKEGNFVVYATYLANLAAIIWWMASTVFFRISDPSHIFLNTKNLYISATLIASSFYYFSYIFPANNNLYMKKLCTVAGINIVLVCLIIFTDFVIKNGAVNPSGENVAAFGSLFVFYAIFILYYFCSSFARLFLKYKKEKDPSKRGQLLFVFIGYSVSGLLAFIADLLFPLLGQFQYVWIGPAAGIFAAVFTTYAVKKYQFLSIKMFTVELIICASWVVAVIRVSAFADAPDPFIDVVYVLITILIGYLLMQSIKNESAQRERNEDLVSQLTVANSRLIEADILKNKFVSLATHQMASPLTAMKVYANFLKEGGHASENDAIVERAADNFISIVTNFLDVSKLDADETQYSLSPVNFGEIAAVFSQQSVSAKAKNVSLEACPHEIAIYCNFEKLKRALENILENSIRHSGPGDTVHVSLTCKMPEKTAKIIISDTGQRRLPSVSPELIRTFSSEGDVMEANIVGSSLGLYSAKQSIERQRGKFTAKHDEAAKKYQFIIEFPML